ncbi:MAG: uncharacterized membrane protein YqaE (UPF0057 family) [Flavobacteriales bacterium]|jgi:uncharacterized membrane protein YqaE (UPF0057 family)|tara:strand:- start:3841 stop:4524 length:684 start_codon:yes stop_codon:yes gene_type:complete
MKNLSVKIAVFAIVAFGMVLSSCNSTIEVTKRQHRKGYHVSVSKKNSDISLEKYQEEEVVLEATKKRVVNDALVDLISSKSTDGNVESNNSNISDNKNVETSQESLNYKIKKPSLLQTVKAVKKARKDFKQLKKTTVSNTSSDEDWDISSDMMFVLMLILAVLLPPAAVFLIKGKSNAFNLNFILWLIGFLGVGLSTTAIAGFGFAWLAMVLAIAHALLVIFGNSSN